MHERHGAPLLSVSPCGVVLLVSFDVGVTGAVNFGAEMREGGLLRVVGGGGGEKRRLLGIECCGHDVGFFE